MTGWARDVMMRTLLRPKRISSRFQIMRTARTSSPSDVPTSRTPMTVGAEVIVLRPLIVPPSAALIPERSARAPLGAARSPACRAHPGVGPVALGARRFCVANGAARVGHEHVVEGGAGDV